MLLLDEKMITERLEALPETLSGLLSVAMSDLRSVAALDYFSVNMLQFFDYVSEPGRCRVCLAGAVLFSRVIPFCHAHVAAVAYTNKFTRRDWRKLFGVDYLSRGHVGHAWGELVRNVKTYSELRAAAPEKIGLTQVQHAWLVDNFNVPIVGYVSDAQTPDLRDQFVAQLTELADTLRRVGL